MEPEQPKKEIPVPWDLRDLYKTRVIILLESEPLSNKYRQVVFTKMQFQLFQIFFNNMWPVHEGQLYNLPPGARAVDIQLSGDPNLISLPEHLTDFI